MGNQGFQDRPGASSFCLLKVGCYNFGFCAGIKGSRRCWLVSSKFHMFTRIPGKMIQFDHSNVFQIGCFKSVNVQIFLENPVYNVIFTISTVSQEVQQQQQQHLEIMFPKAMPEALQTGSFFSFPLLTTGQMAVTKLCR